MTDNEQFTIHTDRLNQERDEACERLEKLRAMNLDERRGLLGKMQAMQSENQCNTAAPKPWAEAPIEEKLERMRGMVKKLNARFEYFETRLADISQVIAQNSEELLQHRHDHADGGKVMLPAESNHVKRVQKLYGNPGCGQQQPAMDVDPAKAFFLGGEFIRAVPLGLVRPRASVYGGNSMK